MQLSEASFISQATADDDPNMLLANTNNLLAVVGISAKKVTSTGELTRVASSMFVAIFEALFHVRLEGIIRNPQSKEEYAHNAQRVIDSLSERIKFDLAHITGESIVMGDISSLSNLVNIFIRIVAMTSREAKDFAGMQDVFRGATPTGAEDNISDIESASLSTRDSFEQPPQKHTHHEIPVPKGVVPRRIPKPARAVKVSGVEQLLRSSLNTLQQEEKLEEARKRRSLLQQKRESKLMDVNRRKSETSLRALQSRWVQDASRLEDSFELKKENEEEVALRKIYRGLLHKMHEWKIDEHAETKERINTQREDAEWKVKALQALYEDRVRLLRDQDDYLDGDKRAIYAEKRMTEELKHMYDDKQERALEERLTLLDQRRKAMIFRRQDARRNLLSFLSVEKWHDMLRTYSSSSGASPYPSSPSSAGGFNRHKTSSSSHGRKSLNKSKSSYKRIGGSGGTQTHHNTTGSRRRPQSARR